MTISVAQVAEHRRNIGGIVDLMSADLRDVWRSLDLSNPPAVQAFLEALLPELGAVYQSQAAAVAADWYAELREQAGVPGIPRPRVAEPPPAERFRALAGWGTGPLWSATPAAGEALTRLTGAMTRVVRDGDRDTIVASAREDRVRTTWARQASAGACAFCRMLALRGGTYTTEASAGGGRLDQDYHDDCNCVTVPVHRGQELDVPDYQAPWQDAYDAATAEVGASDPSRVLAHMRAAMGTH